MTVDALEVLADHFFEQQRRDGGADEGDEREAERVREDGAIAALALGKGAEELAASVPEEDRQSARMAPSWMTMVYIFQKPSLKIDVQQRLGDAQMRGGGDGQELGESLDDAERSESR